MTTSDPGDQYPFDSEWVNDKEAMPALADSKRHLHRHAQSAAKTGLHYYSTEGRTGQHEVDSEVPGSRDTLTIISHDAPLRRLGLDGLFMQITHSEVIGTPAITRYGEAYTQTVTGYLFYETPDGIHVDKRISQIFKVTAH